MSLHVGSGAAAGALVRSPLAVIPLGLALHFLGDLVPHRDIPQRRFETWSGVAALALVAAGRGPWDATTLGALASSAPDVEHLIRLPRPGGRKLFPSHRWARYHNSGGIRAGAQLVVAGVLLGFALSAR